MTPSDTPVETLASRAGAAFAAYQAGERERMSELVDLVTPILWHTVRAQRVGHDQAEDIVQTTWLRLVHHAEAVQDPRAVLAWLIVTAKRESWRIVRDARRTQPLPDYEEADPTLETTLDGPETAALATLEGRVLWRHIEALPERCRSLLRVVAFCDRPDYAAVADALGMPIGSIGPTRGRCLAKLRLLLDTDPHWGDLMNDATPELELALGPIDDRDLTALAVLRSVYERGDPVPPGLVDRVKFAITLDDLEAEVARLQRDSLDALPELVARSDELLKARSVTFTSDTVTTMVTITPIDASTVRLDGWAAPGAHLDVELRLGDTSRHVVADEDGRFVFDGVEHGLAQLVLRPSPESGGHPVITPAIEL